MSKITASNIFLVFLLIIRTYCQQDLEELQESSSFNNIIQAIKYVNVLFCSSGEEEACVKASRAVKHVSENLELPEGSYRALLTHDNDLAAIYGMKKLPAIVFFRNGQPIQYTDDMTRQDDMLEWYQQNQEVSGKVLTDATFEHDTQAASGATTGDWLLMFYDSEKCADSLAVWEAVASKLKHKMNVARVDTGSNPKLVERFNLTECLTIRMFRHGAMYDYVFKNRDVSTLTSFADTWYKNVKSVPVPAEPSPFDQLTEEAAKYLKALFAESGVTSVVAICICIAALGSALILFCLCAATKKPKVKDA